MTEKNRYGQYFTVGVIADFMVSLISHSNESKVLEPSCGKGVFLDKLVEHEFKNISAYEVDATLGARYDFVKFGRNRQTLWGGCTDANPKLLLNDT